MSSDSTKARPLQEAEDSFRAERKLVTALLLLIVAATSWVAAFDTAWTA